MAEPPAIEWRCLVAFMRSVRMMSVERAEAAGLLAAYELLRNHDVLVPVEIRGEFLGQRCGGVCAGADGRASDCRRWAHHEGPCESPAKEASDG